MQIDQEKVSGDVLVREQVFCNPLLLPVTPRNPLSSPVEVHRQVMAATSATGGATLLGLSASLGFIPSKKQFKWNGSLASLKEFWISELEGGNAHSLVNINSNANSGVEV